MTKVIHQFRNTKLQLWPVINVEKCLKSLKSVQISILEQKITPEVIRTDQNWEKILGMLASK